MSHHHDIPAIGVVPDAAHHAFAAGQPGVALSLAFTDLNQAPIAMSAAE